jgi:hypothetical protein
MTPDEVLNVLDAGAFEELVGVAEDERLEFKGQPYRLDDDQQAFELAKDVSALANASAGGLLVIGFETERTQGSAADTVARSSPFARNLVDEVQYLDKIKQLIYPLVAGVQVVFKPTPEDEHRGVTVVVVPSQPEDQKYFLVSKAFVGPEGAPGWLVGVSIRSFDRDRSLSIGELHGLIGRGRNISGQLDEIHALVAQVDARGRAAEEADARAPADEVLARIAEGLGELEEEQ